LTTSSSAVSNQLSCIYCGDIGKPLSREHVIPDGLKGTIVLPNASCDLCRIITSRYEGHCLRKVYGVLRYTTGIHSAKHKKRRGTSFDVHIEENGVTTITNVPFDKVPTTFPVLNLPMPGLLRGVSDDETSPQALLNICGIHPDIHERVLALGEVANAFTHVDMHPHSLMSMLGKIAYSYAVHELGRDGFFPLIQDLCLLKEPRPFKYVGSDWLPPVRSLERPHDLQIREHNGYIIVRVHLFTEYTSHANVVIVGKRNEKTPILLGHVNKISNIAAALGFVQNRQPRPS
jgi:hypothetical protein